MNQLNTSKSKRNTRSRHRTSSINIVISVSDLPTCIAYWVCSCGCSSRLTDFEVPRGFLPGGRGFLTPDVFLAIILQSIRKKEEEGAEWEGRMMLKEKHTNIES